MKRKLTTIFCADGAGFGAHMARDEAGTFRRLARMREIMAEQFAAHDGRQVNTWGDAVIAEFASVVEAVRCAVAVQDAIAADNRTVAPQERLEFRIGINLGDVMLDGDDLVGDGVNVASRLESIATPGGIAVSATVHDLVHRQLTLGFEGLGEQVVKDKDDPVHAFRVIMPNRNTPDDGSDANNEDDFGVSPSIDSRFQRTGAKADGIWNWLMAQPRGVRRSAGMIGFFFALNVLFTGIASPWFIFPSIPFAIHIFHHVRRSRSASK